MITEDYVSFEIAKLLKEKGFDEYCHAYWDLTTETKTPKIGLSVSSKNWNYKWNPIPFPISAPTLQMAIKWLLKKYNIFICVLFLEESNEFGYTIEDIIKKKYIITSKNSSYKGPEEAYEVAIKYCLENLI